MKLYHSPGACSLAPHIAFRESGLEVELVRADIRAKKLPDGSDYLAVNPKGAVPALGLANGEVLTENAVILQYIADQALGSDLLPPEGLRRYRVLEWTIFVSTEIHKGFAPLWNLAAGPEAKEAARELLAKKFDFVAGRLSEQDYLTGESFTIADCYLFTVLRWTRIHDIDLGRWPVLKSYQERVSSRPAVMQALKEEGLD